MKQNFFDQLDGGWGDVIADTYKKENAFKPPYKKSTYNNETSIELAEIYVKKPELVENKELYFENGLEYIPGYSFYKTNIIGDLIFPNSLKQIGLLAFANCKKLKGNLNLPNSIHFLGSRAFMNCGFTGDLVIPESVNYIGPYTFVGCNFAKIYVDKSNVNLFSENWNSGCDAEIVYY